MIKDMAFGSSVQSMQLWRQAFRERVGKWRDGYSQEERLKMGRMLESGFVERVFRRMRMAQMME